MQRNSHQEMVAIATKTVKNEKKLDRNERKQFSRLQKQLNTAVQHKQITFSSNQPNKQSVLNNSKIVKQPVPEIKKTDSRIETSGNRSYDWWSGSPQDWRNEEREESLMDPKWNCSLSNTNELSEEEEITETVQRTRKIIRGGRKNRDSSDCETRHASRVKWQLEPDQQREADQRLLSFWQLIGGEDNIRENRELVAHTQEVKDSSEHESSSALTKPIASAERKLSEVQVIEMDLTTTEEAESEEEVCSIEPPKGLGKTKLQKQQQVETLDNLAKLFDKSLLAELTTEDTWMDRLRRVIERGDKQGFELMGPYTNPLWSQMAVQDNCILVNNRLAVPVQLRQAVLKRIHRGHPGQEAMLGAAQYLWWPQMNKDIVNLAEECRSCTRYGKNVKYLFSKNTSKPLPLLTQPGQEVQLDYAGPIENQKGKKIYLLVAIDRFSKFPSVKVTKSTSGKCTVKFLRSYIDTHGVPESIRSDQFSGFKGKTLKKFCSELNIEQKFCPVGDHRGCGLVERTIQTIKRRLGVMMLEENNKSINLCLSIIMRDLRWNKQKTIQVSPFQAHFGRLPKTEFKIVRDRFLNDSDYLDKQHLERSALRASQLKRRIDQSKENLKIVRKGQLSRDTSPLHKQQLTSDRDKERAKALKELLEANARWNNERRDAAKNDIRKLVDETGLLNPDLRKEMIYS